MKFLSSFWQFLTKHITFKRFIILVIVFTFCLPILKGVFFGSEEDESVESFGRYSYKYVKGNEWSTDNLLIIPIQGLILTEESALPDPFSFLSNQGVTYGYQVKDMLYRAAENDSVHGILLTINSPGGTITGSEAISQGIQHYKEVTGKPVHAHIRELGASGAYWDAVVADKVYADTGSIVGSIGVLLGPFTYYDNIIEEGSVLGGVTTEQGIEHEYFTAGQYKDSGSPYRRLTDEERKHWQQSVDNEYSVFVSHVSKYRNISEDTIRSKIKALPYETKRAKELSLIDDVASEEVALAILAKEAGLQEGSYKVVTEKEKTDIFEDLFAVVARPLSPQAKTPSVCTLCNSPLYLYDSSYSLFR